MLPEPPVIAKPGLFKEFKAFYRDVVTDILGTKIYRRYREKVDRQRRVVGKLFVLANLIAAAIYLGWYLTVLNWKVWYISVPFFFAETAGLVTATLFALIIWYPRYHHPAGQTWETMPSVDVFITTCGESLDVLSPTVEAAAAIDYEPKKVYILDDMNSPDVQKLAKAAGCHYLSRKKKDNAKAGNLNYGLNHTQGQFILTLDADQVSDPEIIKKVIGYFKFPGVGFVQTAQRFVLPKGDPFGNSDELFYKVMQLSKDNDNAAFSCGSGVIYRRVALESIGGFSTWNLVEDVHTSVQLHASGWRSIYHNYPLSTGSAPSDIVNVCKQREQWAIDSLRLLFWDVPFRQRGLNLKQKLQYFQVGFVYMISAVVMPFYFIVPIWSLLTGRFLIVAPLATYAVYRGIYLLFTVLATFFLQRPAASTKPYKMWAGLFPVYFSAVIKALSSKSSKPIYRVNEKGIQQPGWLATLKPISLQMSIIALIILAIIYRAFNLHKNLDLFVVNTIWGFWVFWSLSGICYAALKPKRWPSE